MAYNKTPNNEASELIEKVVYLNRVSKTVKGGRVMKFSALVVVGDGKGTVGYGLGKAAEVSEAILKGIADAKKKMRHIRIISRLTGNYCKNPGQFHTGIKELLRFLLEPSLHSESVPS